MPMLRSQHLDDHLVAALEREDIRLLRVEWLLAQPSHFKMPRRQDLEKIEYADEGWSPLLIGKEAVALLRNGKREVGALSYGWLLPWDPDPTGARLALLQEVLRMHPQIRALFWDQATLYQPPRSKGEEEAFSRALDVMMDLYASAVGTTYTLLLLARAPLTHFPLCALFPEYARPNPTHPSTPSERPHRRAFVSVCVAGCCRSRSSRPVQRSLTGCFALATCRRAWTRLLSKLN